MTNKKMERMTFEVWLRGLTLTHVINATLFLAAAAAVVGFVLVLKHHDDQTTLGDCIRYRQSVFGYTECETSDD